MSEEDVNSTETATTEINKYTAQTNKRIHSLFRQQRRRQAFRLWTTQGHLPVAEASDVEVALSSEEGDNEAALRDSAVEGVLSSVLVGAGSNTTISVVAVVEEEDVDLAGGTTSPSVTVMRLFRSSPNGPLWRRLTFLVWAS